MRAGTLKPLFSWRGAVCSAESDLPPTTRLVALVLSLHMSERGTNCFPTVAALAEESGLSDRAVQIQLKVLRDKGWLSMRAPKVAGRGNRNEYWATVPGKGEGDSPITEKERVKDVHPYRVGRVNVTTKKGERDDMNRDLGLFTEDVKQGRTTGASPAPPAAGPSEIQTLVSFYVDECSAAGYQPSAQWKRIMGNQTKALVCEKSGDAIKTAIMRIAIEHKQPGVLAAVLTDIESEANGKPRPTNQSNGNGHRPEPPEGAGRRRGWEPSSGQTYDQYLRGEYPDAW
jgi:hypothetical protein